MSTNEQYTIDDPITVELTVAARLLRMATPDHREQLAQDDALATLLGRQALALARRRLYERASDTA